ncbi:hypothetical protein TNCV_2450541 [Trichonephila clavipes]|nr:hypothetical protein TNCV_2450541 [Trichonephila clavipes]
MGAFVPPGWHHHPGCGRWEDEERWSEKHLMNGGRDERPNLGNCVVSAEWYDSPGWALAFPRSLFQTRLLPASVL